MQEILHAIFGNDIKASLLVIFNLVVIESLLSVDNAAVLATMVMDLPKSQRKKALRYGILGAYVFRGLCLLFAAMLIKVWWLKPLGGLYLLYISYDFFTTKQTKTHDDDTLEIKHNPIYGFFVKSLGAFWSTIILIELMDLTFSIDNVFAAVAFTDNIYLIWTGVFIGILSMRLVTGAFVTVMEKFPFLDKVAFVVIIILGLKLFMSGVTHFIPDTAFAHFIESEHTDTYLSIMTVVIFFLPILTSITFNYPKRK